MSQRIADIPGLSHVWAIVKKDLEVWIDFSIDPQIFFQSWKSSSCLGMVYFLGDTVAYFLRLEQDFFFSLEIANLYQEKKKIFDCIVLLHLSENTAVILVHSSC